MKTKFDPQKHRRRSIRLKNYDYSSQGAYFVTIVTQERERLFGEIIEKEMCLSEYGEIVQKWWNEIPIHFPGVEIGAFVIMPNHVHGIIFITEESRGEVIWPRDKQNQNNVFGEPHITIIEDRKTHPYADQHWDKLWRISNINPPKI